MSSHPEAQCVWLMSVYLEATELRLRKMTVATDCTLSPPPLQLQLLLSATSGPKSAGQTSSNWFPVVLKYTCVQAPATLPLRHASQFGHHNRGSNRNKGGQNNSWGVSGIMQQPLFYRKWNMMSSLGFVRDKGGRLHEKARTYLDRLGRKPLKPLKANIFSAPPWNFVLASVELNI